MILLRNKIVRIWALPTQKMKHLRKCHVPIFWLILLLLVWPVNDQCYGHQLDQCDFHITVCTYLTFSFDCDSFLPALLQSLMKIQLLWETCGTNTLWWLKSWQGALQFCWVSCYSWVCNLMVYIFAGKIYTVVWELLWLLFNFHILLAMTFSVVLISV